MKHNPTPSSRVRHDVAILRSCLLFLLVASACGGNDGPADVTSADSGSDVSEISDAARDGSVPDSGENKRDSAVDVLGEDGSSISATLLFKHGFEGDIQLIDGNRQPGYIDIVGTDPNTGYDFSELTYNGGYFAGIHKVMNFGAGTTYDDNASNEIVTIAGWDGAPTRCLKQVVSNWPQERSVTQSTVQINNITTNPTALYVRMRMKMAVSDVPDNYDWKVLGGYKTASYDGGGEGVRLAFRYGRAGTRQVSPAAGVAEGDYYSAITLDDGVNTTYANWDHSSSTVLPPDDEWFLMEYYIEWGDGRTDGVAWLKVDGELVGTNTGPLTYNGDVMKYLFLWQMYGGNWASTGATTNPHTQYIDDVEMWEGVPY